MWPKREEEPKREGEDSEEARARGRKEAARERGSEPGCTFPALPALPAIRGSALYKYPGTFPMYLYDEP